MCLYTTNIVLYKLYAYWYISNFSLITHNATHCRAEVPAHGQRGLRDVGPADLAVRPAVRLPQLQIRTHPQGTVVFSVQLQPQYYSSNTIIIH